MLKKIKAIVKKNKIMLNIYEFFFQRPIYNYYKKKYEKKVLLSYSTYHFNKKNYTAHTNYSESLIIAKVFDNLGYIVDIFNNRNNYNINFDDYDIIFGGGALMYKSLEARTSAITIYYGTGSHPWQCTDASLKRVLEFYNKTNYIAMKSTRMQDINAGLAASLCKYVLCIGNEQTKKTFIDNHCKNVSMINPTFHSLKNIEVINKESNSKNNFLYFGSYGLLHKGLDLVIDAIKKFPDCTLHICGYVDREKDFISKLDFPDNIVVHGFIDIESKIFKDLSRKCAFTILPSASEGIATAIITGMGRGAMIPIVTKECGIDLDDFGIEIEKLTVKSVEMSIQESLNLSEVEIDKRSQASQQKAYEYYTLKNYEKNLTNYLKNIKND